MASNTSKQNASVPQLLSATYHSPHNSHFSHTKQIVIAKPLDRTAYLAALRVATVELQEQVNKDLTLRMENDKASATDAASKAGMGDDAKEEDNYGEEVPDED
jgi:hypothetical protein